MMWDLWLERAKPIVPVIVVDDVAHAIPLAQALVAGGVRLLEVTLRTQVGLDAIKLIRHAVPEAIVGAGTVTNEQQFEQALSKGAQFIVSPGSSAALFAAARAWGGAYLPGVATASEVMQARELGFRYQKLFPAMVIGGEALLSSMAGPFADVHFCPTGGVDGHNYRQLLAHRNVFAVGGSWLTPTEQMQRQQWSTIEAMAISC